MIRDDIIKELEREVNELLVNNSSAVNRYECGDEIRLNVADAIEDLEVNHNTSWAVEIFRRNADDLDNIAITYRGNKITYKELFEKAFKYAKTLKELGFKKGDEIPVCVSNIPEFVYLLLAISFIGGKINVVGDWFAEDYLLSIINGTGSKCIFVSDNVYGNIADVIDKSNVTDVVMFSLTDSLLEDKFGNKFNPYNEIDRVYCDFTNRVNQYKKSSHKNVISEQEFITLGEKYNANVVERCDIDDAFAVTYTSGTTNPGHPKGCLHSNRSYITLSRFKESDVSGMPSMRDLIVLAHIPTYTHMQLSCAISDTLYEKCTLAMEPFYSKETFFNSLIINKPNFAPASIGCWAYVCKLLNYDERFKRINMPYLMLPTVTGESCSNGEEKFFNYTARKHKFGIGKLPFPLAPVTFSIGGGTSESSGIFVTLYKSLQEKKLNNLLHKNSLGLTPHKFVELEVLDENGNYCDIDEPGLLVANSPCSMMGYTDASFNDKIYVKDNYGKDWLNLGTYSYKSDKDGRIKMKGRLNDFIPLENGKILPYYIIEDEIMKDTKNIMSASVVKVVEDDKPFYVCHMEFQPNMISTKTFAMRGCIERLNKILPPEVMEVFYFRVRNFYESFPMAPSGKRDTKQLIAEGLSDSCINILDYGKNETNAKVRSLKKNIDNI